MRAIIVGLGSLVLAGCGGSLVGASSDSATGRIDASAVSMLEVDVGTAGATVDCLRSLPAGFAEGMETTADDAYLSRPLRVCLDAVYAADQRGVGSGVDSLLLALSDVVDVLNAYDHPFEVGETRNGLPEGAEGEVDAFVRSLEHVADQVGISP